MEEFIANVTKHLGSVRRYVRLHHCVMFLVFGLRAVGGLFFGGGGGILVQVLSLFELKACCFRGLNVRIVLSSRGAYKIVIVVNCSGIGKSHEDATGPAGVVIARFARFAFDNKWEK